MSEPERMRAQAAPDKPKRTARIVITPTGDRLLIEAWSTGEMELSVREGHRWWPLTTSSGWHEAVAP
jgi:hypothetical protein